MKNHLQKHLIFYLGLMQIILGWVAGTDFKTLTLASTAIEVSGLLTLIIKYIQSNWPEDSEVFTPPDKPAQPVEKRQ